MDEENQNSKDSERLGLEYCVARVSVDAQNVTRKHTRDCDRSQNVEVSQFCNLAMRERIDSDARCIYARCMNDCRA